jgi:hypothetical protein
MTGAPDQNRVKTLPAPKVISIPFGQHWQVVRPSVYRYEDQNWINEFFEIGRLRLSTFAKFATYPDEIRGDKDEGHDASYGETTDNKSVVVARCSHHLNHQLREGFKRDSAFQIMDTVGFAFEISRQLPGFRGGLEGTCIYRNNRSINRKINIDTEKYRLPDGNIDMKMISDLCRELGGPELVLLKHKKYENQQEYRILWELDAVSGESIDIVAPKARQFCRKVDGAEY